MTVQNTSADSGVELLAAIKCLALDSLAARTSDLLTAAGIPAMLLKGPATVRRLYPDEPFRRPYSDVDLLVPADRFDDAQAVLRANAYRWRLAGVRDSELAWHETAWGAPESNNLTVDLHRGFAGVTQPAAFFDGLWARREEMVLAGSTVWVPSTGGSAFILALHAAHPGKARKPLADIRRAHQIFGPEAWREAAELARSCGAESAWRAGVELLPDGSRLADDLGVDGVVAAESWLAGRQYDRVSVSLAAALTETSARARAAHILRRVIPTPAFIRLSDPLARHGRGALARAYLRRGGKAVVGAPGAVVNVMVARRAVRPRTASVASRARRIVLETDAPAMRAAAWAWRALASSRRQVRENRLTCLDLPAPGTVRPRDRRAVLSVLRVRGATCLERSIVLQRFDAAAGRRRVLIVGVTGPSAGFRAHAWLDADRRPDTGFQEILRLEAPESWVGVRPQRAR